MATNAKCGWAILSALALVLSASCGPAECPNNGVCKTDGGGTCPSGDCTTPDGGGTDGGVGPNDPSQFVLKAPADTAPSQWTFYWLGSTTQEIVPGCADQQVCTFQVENAGDYKFLPVHPSRLMPPKSALIMRYGKRVEISWDGVGECGVKIGEGTEQGHWPYRDPEHADWGKVYFQTSVFTDKVVLNDLNAVGAHKLLSGSNFVVVTGLNFSGRSGDDQTWQEFSGQISSDRETITYRLLETFQGEVNRDILGTFHRFHPQ